MKQEGLEEEKLEMPPEEEAKLRNLVNASGFVFQVGVQHLIESGRAAHGWELQSFEHPWKTDRGEGFVDLVLARGKLRIAVECKRPRDGEWVFLVDSAKEPTSTARCQWAHGGPKLKDMIGWHDFSLIPVSHESSFCVVRGSGEGDRGLLERTGAVLSDSLRSLAIDELAVESWGGGFPTIHLPVLVTTAALYVCRYNPAQVDMARGELVGAEFERVEIVRFRKSLAQDSSPYASIVDLSAIRADKERTVIVTTPDYLNTFLEKLRLSPIEGWMEPPWVAARRLEGGGGHEG